MMEFDDKKAVTEDYFMYNLQPSEQSFSDPEDHRRTRVHNGHPQRPMDPNNFKDPKATQRPQKTSHNV